MASVLTSAPPHILTVGGFLGAGKTTLVNHLLGQSDGQRIVVFVNDFGAINIDYDLIESADSDRVSLTNGCVCCSLNDDLIGSIVSFCMSDPPDAFIVEASGVADPRQLDQSMATLQRAGHVHLAGRVYVVDLDQFGELDYADTEQVVDHAVASDLVLLNKWDLADESQVQGVETMLERSAPACITRRTEFCRVSLSELLLNSTLLPQLSLNDATARQPRIQASDKFASWSCQDFDPVSRLNFDLILEILRNTAVRAKGIIYFAEDPDTAIQIDFVGNRAVTRAITSDNGIQQSRFVAIGYRDKFSSEALSTYFIQ